MAEKEKKRNKKNGEEKEHKVPWQEKYATAKEIKAYTLFVSRDALNIDGLSEATLEKMIDQGFIHEYADLFRLDRYKEVITQMEGFGEKVGLAFQLADDVIDLRSPSDVTGKTPGTDLREGVDTMPVLILRRRAVGIGGLHAHSIAAGRITQESELRAGGLAAPVDAPHYRVGARPAVALFTPEKKGGPAFVRVYTLAAMLEAASPTATTSAPAPWPGSLR